MGIKMKNVQSSSWKSLLGAVVCVCVLAACNDKEKEASAPAGLPDVPAGYVVVKAEDVGIVSDLPGRLEATRVAEVRPQVSGIILRRLFTEGGDVKAGESLFEIDDAIYQAALLSAQAQLAQAQANFTEAKAQADRLKPLVSANAVSKQEYDSAVAAQKIAAANIQSAKAAINTAQVNINYAKVLSPISGRIGRAYVTEGALVNAASTELAVVQQIDTLYVNFMRSAADVIKLQQDIENGLYARASDGSIPVTIVLENGEVYPEPGRLLFSDLTVDPSTGQISLRAELNNPNRLLLPNLYVRVRLEQVKIPNAFLVPQQAVTRLASGDSLYVILPDNTVQKRAVIISGRKGTDWIVSSGLADGERVMVDGFTKWQGVMEAAKQMSAATGKTIPVHVAPSPWLGDIVDSAQKNVSEQEANSVDHEPSNETTATPDAADTKE